MIVLVGVEGGRSGGGLVWFGREGKKCIPPLFPTPGLYQMEIDKTFESESGKEKKQKAKSTKKKKKKE